MIRDFSVFPNDENGDALFNMASQGDNLEKKREVNFSVVFPTRESALAFAIQMLQKDNKVSFSAAGGSKEKPWLVELHPIILPTHASISGFESSLCQESLALGGINDGWGCFAQY